MVDGGDHFFGGHAADSSVLHQRSAVNTLGTRIQILTAPVSGHCRLGYRSDALVCIVAVQVSLEGVTAGTDFCVAVGHILVHVLTQGSYGSVIQLRSIVLANKGVIAVVGQYGSTDLASGCQCSIVILDGVVVLLGQLAQISLGGLCQFTACLVGLILEQHIPNRFAHGADFLLAAGFFEVGGEGAKALSYILEIVQSNQVVYFVRFVFVGNGSFLDVFQGVQAAFSSTQHLEHFVQCVIGSAQVFLLLSLFLGELLQQGGQIAQRVLAPFGQFCVAGRNVVDAKRKQLIKAHLRIFLVQVGIRHIGIPFPVTVNDVCLIHGAAQKIKQRGRHTHDQITDRGGVGDGHPQLLLKRLFDIRLIEQCRNIGVYQFRQCVKGGIGTCGVLPDALVFVRCKCSEPDRAGGDHHYYSQK